MNQRNDARTRLWIRSPDSLGNEVDLTLVEAAHRVWERARFIVIRYLVEDTDAADILEEVVDSTSASQNGHTSIQHLDAYLLKAVARESIRRRYRSRRLTFVDPTDLERLAGSIAYDWDRQLDDEKWMKLLRASLDGKGREMLDYRVLEYDWRFIAVALDYSNEHTAEVQFRKKVNKALERIQANHGPSSRKPYRWNSNET